MTIFLLTLYSVAAVVCLLVGVYIVLNIESDPVMFVGIFMVLAFWAWPAILILTILYQLGVRLAKKLGVIE